MTNTRECERVREAIAAMLEGERLDDALHAHLVECDECRDARHDAERAANAVKHVASDYVHPADFEARVLAALDARAGGGSVGSDAKEARTAEQLVVRHPLRSEITVPPAFRDSIPSPPARDPVAAESTPSTASLARPRRARWIAAGTMALAAAAAVPLALRLRTEPVAHKPGPVAEVRTAWRGRLASVARASADATGGVEVRPAGAHAFAPLAPGAEIPQGAEVRTDPRTRARIELADGTHVVLDRATSLRLDPAHPRTASLVAGALVADVAHLADGPLAHIALPQGNVTVLGTKFALAADDARSTVRVTRGTVRLDDARGDEVRVEPGQEGVLAHDARPAVSPAVDLAESVAWSESEHDEAREEPDAPVVGLGELRARRPGQTNERDHQVALVGHAVKVRIAGNMARTEVEETFRNDTDHELEGIYRFPLPPEGQVENLALDVHGQMEDGAFVDRQRAAAIWHGVIQNAVHPILHAQQTDELVWVPGPWRDPALLEWQRGGRFELRVFPIPAHGTRRVALAYTQQVPASGGTRRYVYPFAHDANGSTRVEQVDLDVQVLGADAARGVHARGYPLTEDNNGTTAGATHLAFSQNTFVPAGDLVIEYALPDRDAPVTAWAFTPPPAAPDAGAPVQPEPAFAALALRPVLPHWTDARPHDYALVIDASRSMVGERLARASHLARAMVSEMDPRDRVTVLACDIACRVLPGGLQFASAATADAVNAFLAREEPAGATDLVAQVRAAADVLRSADREGARAARIVYVGDGAATVGYRRPDMVAAEVASAMPGANASLTAVAVGGDADTSLLTVMARAGGGAVVPYVPGEALAAAALSVLEATYGVALRDPVVELPAGLDAVAPARLPTLRAGGELVIAARMREPEVRGDVVLRGTVAGEPFEARYPVQVRASDSAGNAFVPRLYAAARIADLESDGGASARDEAVSLSQRFRVASRYTSLLVLESDAMYHAFGVQRVGTAAVNWTGEQAAEPVMLPSLAARGASDLAAPTAPTTESAGDGRDDASNAGPAGSTREADNEAEPETAATGASAQSPSASHASSGGGGAMRRGRAPLLLQSSWDYARPSSQPPAADRAATEGHWARRVWVRRATVTASGGASEEAIDRVDGARASLEAMPDSKTRHAELYRWLSLAGRFDEANEIATRWATRDAMDPDALVRLADVEARRGERARAVRVLAGTVDVRPDDLALQRRMALLFERAGERGAACAFRVAMAQVQPSDAAIVADAVRCERALGHDASAARLLDAVSAVDARSRVEQLASSASAGMAEGVRGEVTVDARWDAPVDLDVAIVDPRGARVTWMGGRTSGLTVRGANDTHSEALGIARASVGEWVVEVSRADEDRRAVRGTVDVRVMGERRTVSFAMGPNESTVRVARGAVTRESVLETVPGGWK